MIRIKVLHELDLNRNRTLTVPGLQVIVSVNESRVIQLHRPLQSILLPNRDVLWQTSTVKHFIVLSELCVISSVLVRTFTNFASQKLK